MPIKTQYITYCTWLILLLFKTLQSADAGEHIIGPPPSKFKSLTDEVYATQKHLISDTLSLPGYYTWKQELSSNHGLDFVVLNTPIFQMGSVDNETYLDNELDIYLQWRAYQEGDSYGKIFFWGLWVQTFSDNPSGAFAQTQGLNSFPNGGATDPEKTVIAPSALWWEQNFADSGINYKAGQLYAAALYGSNSYLGDDRATFMNTTLGTNQGTPWASGNRGLGAMATISADSLHLTLGFQDAKGDQQAIDFDSFADGQYAYLAEISWKPIFNENDKGTYKATVGYVDRTGPTTDRANRSGWGYILSAEQNFDDRYGTFAIVRQSFDRVVNNTDLTAALGFVFNQAFNRANDQLGIGSFYNTPFNNNHGTLRNEYGIETFWKLQLTPRLSVTPDLQVYLQPAKKAQNDIVIIPGIRLQYVL